MTQESESFASRLDNALAERGAEYGSFRSHFAQIAVMKGEVAHCADPQVRHALEMILVKVARLANNPYHHDSALDIAGYAALIDGMQPSEDERALVQNVVRSAPGKGKAAAEPRAFTPSTFETHRD